MQSSKGLEFRSVILVGLGHLDAPETKTADRMTLLFAGMTRAKERLMFTASGKSQFTERLESPGFKLLSRELKCSLRGIDLKTLVYREGFGDGSPKQQACGRISVHGVVDANGSNPSGFQAINPKSAFETTDYADRADFQWVVKAGSFT